MNDEAEAQILANLLAESESERQAERDEKRELRVLIEALGAKIDALTVAAKAVQPAISAPGGKARSIKIGKHTISLTVTGRDENERISEADVSLQ